MCGIFGVFLRPESEIDLERVISATELDGNALKNAGSLAAGLTYYGLYELQNRGQDSSGIVVSDGEIFKKNLGLGLVKEAHSQKKLEQLRGNIATGHNRYSITGKIRPQNIQPFTIDSPELLALGHNGNLLNQDSLRETLDGLVHELGIEDKLKLKSTTDSELILNLIVAHMIRDNSTIEEAIVSALNHAIGSYSLVIATKDKLIGVRDAYENRPLHVARIAGSYFLTSERRVIDYMVYLANYKMKFPDFIREVKGGEIVTITKEGIQKIEGKISRDPDDETLNRLLRCCFDDSYVKRGDDPCIYKLRSRFGEKLYEEDRLKGRLTKNAVVVGVPDSGLISAEGYSSASGMPLIHGLRRDHYYIKRTFIEPYQKGRDIGALMKYYVIPDAVKDKKVVLIDDSIVRATTLSNIIKLMRLIGHVKELHPRIATPPYITPCYLGIHTPEKEELIAHGLNESQLELFFMARFYGVDYDKDKLKNKVSQDPDIHQIVKQSIRDNENYLTDEERDPIEPDRFSLKYLSLKGFKDCFREEQDKKCYACFIPDGKGYPPEMQKYLVGKV